MRGLVPPEGTKRKNNGSRSLPGEISTIQRAHQDWRCRGAITCGEEERTMTRCLWICVVCSMAWSDYAAAQTRQPEPPDPNGTRLILGPTARTLKQGQFSVDFSTIVGGPLVEVGLTSRVSLGAG